MTGSRDGSCRTNGLTDPTGIISIVPTDEYEVVKRPGIAAPYPGQSAVLLFHDSWRDDETLWWRPSDDDDWVELERPARGSTFGLLPGSSVRLDSPPGLVLTGMV